MPKQNRTGEAKKHTESGEEKAKGGENMTREEQIAFVVDFLEKSYPGARTMDDVELMTRLERAIAVMKTPAEIDVFRPDFEEIYIEREILKELEAAK